MTQFGIQNEPKIDPRRHLKQNLFWNTFWDRFGRAGVGGAKGAALREGLRPGDTALLVDDSIAELVHPSVTGDCGAEAGEVHRVLFVRLL